MNPPKGQHYVPEVLLKSFADDADWLHVVRRAEPNLVRQTRVGRAFKQSHLYSQITDEGLKDPQVELDLSRLESEVAPILAKLISSCRHDSIPVLTPSELDEWYRFFIVQWKRVPDLHEAVGSEKNAHELLSEIHATLRSQHPKRVSEIDELAKPDRMARTVRNTRVRSTLTISPRILTLFRQRGLRLVRARTKGKSFIIGSRPVIQMGFKPGLTLYDAPTEMWLPISQDVIAGVGAGSRVELLHFDKSEPIRKLNEAVARQSSAFGCRSRELAASISKAVW